MKGRPVSRGWASLFFMVLLTTFLMAYGCGGGGGGGDGPVSTISYTGVTTQATITDANAEVLSSGTYSGGVTGTSLGVGIFIQNGVIDRPRYLYLAQTLEEAIIQVDVTAPPGVVVSGAIVRESGSIPGDCGGSGSYVIDLDDVTGDFSGTLSFSDYCSEGVTLTGSASFSGRIDLITLGFLRFSLSFDNLTVRTSAGDSATIKGSISFNYQISPATATMDLLLRDDGTGKVYWVNNFSLTAQDMGGFVDFTMSGRYYDPDYGWVAITTTTNFQITVGMEWPYQGVLLLDGNTGIAGGSTRARLTILSSTTYEVDADTNGDGNYDWNSGILNWP